MKFNRKKLIDLRWDNRLTQTKAGLAIGVKPAVYWSWESGKHTPSMPMLLKLAALFKVKPEYFFDPDIS